ncbi:MAG TPA: aldo/keto reductase [Myxococcaceae bacterium]|nr:aldo/keto reductase [Myxococcaceae bacterium]
MNYRMLGRTGLYVSELCFGAMTFGGEGFWKVVGTQGQSEADKLVARSLEAGINFFDTADVYSNGVSEQLLGKALGARRKDIVLATKVRGRTGPGINEVGLSRGHIMDSVHNSLRRLGTDYIDLYQIHGYDSVTPLDETLRALDDLVRQGKVRYLGASNLAAWQLMKSLGISEHRGLSRFESLQAYYSIAGRDLERELVPLMKDQQLGLMVWSPLAGGFLSGKFRRDSQGPEGARRAAFDFPPVDKERAYNVIDAMDAIGQAHGVSVARVALAWLLHQPHVTTLIIGAKTPEQLEDNLAAPALKLTPEQLATLNTVSTLPPEYPGWMITRQNDDRVPKPQ